MRDDKDEWREQLEERKHTRSCLLAVTCKVGSGSGNMFSCLTGVTEYYHNVGKEIRWTQCGIGQTHEDEKRKRNGECATLGLGNEKRMRGVGEEPVPC